MTLQGSSVPVTYGNDMEAMAALENGVALIDRSHWGRLRVSGEDRLRFLHGQSTADFLSVKPGQGCRTVRTADCPPLKCSDPLGCTNTVVNLSVLQQCHRLKIS